MGMAQYPPMPCGVTHPNPEIEAMPQAMREAESHALAGGCGKPLRWVLSYRCVECDRWMHYDCILKHFKEAVDDPR